MYFKVNIYIKCDFMELLIKNQILNSYVDLNQLNSCRFFPQTFQGIYNYL